eukprot:914413-Rhodomonas_salina.3
MIDSHFGHSMGGTEFFVNSGFAFMKPEGQTVAFMQEVVRLLASRPDKMDQLPRLAAGGLGGVPEQSVGWRRVQHGDEQLGAPDGGAADVQRDGPGDCQQRLGLLHAAARLALRGRRDRRAQQLGGRRRGR